jgi:hypothetical protein
MNIIVGKSPLTDNTAKCIDNHSACKTKHRSRFAISRDFVVPAVRAGLDQGLNELHRDLTGLLPQKSTDPFGVSPVLSLLNAPVIDNRWP